LTFNATQIDGQTIIDITTIKDTQFGDFTPTLNDVRGVTFYVADNSKAEIRIRNTKVPESEIQRNPVEDSGEQSIGIQWFKPDYTDYTTWTLGEVNRSFG
jgi:hypothetical protein